MLGVDVRDDVVALINKGEAPFSEPELAVSVSGAVSLGKLRAATMPEPADAFIVAVPTPFLEDRTADLSFIQAAADAVAPVLKAGDLVVLESTSPPGTTVQLSKWLAAVRPDLTFPHDHPETSEVFVAHCPERVLPGRIMIELVMNDRVVGGVSARCAERARALYAVFTQGDMHLTTAATAEMAKLAENAYRDVNIAYANELSMVCDSLEIDVHEVIALSNRHPRVQILKPGPGVGGHCIAVDPWFIVSAAPDRAPLIRQARAVNDSKPGYVVEAVLRDAQRFDSPTVACLGLTFKANVEDVRQSPALQIVETLAQRLAGRILVAEPHLPALPMTLERAVNVEKMDAVPAIASAEIVVLLVDHDAFRGLDMAALGNRVVHDPAGMMLLAADGQTRRPA